MLYISMYKLKTSWSINIQLATLLYIHMFWPLRNQSDVSEFILSSFCLSKVLCVVLGYDVIIVLTIFQCSCAYTIDNYNYYNCCADILCPFHYVLVKYGNCGRLIFFWSLRLDMSNTLGIISECTVELCVERSKV